MFSYFGNRASNLAFRTDSHEFARTAVHRFMETALNDWLDGREKSYTVRQVMDELRGVFGPGAVMPCQLLGRALDSAPDDPARLVLVSEAVQLVARQLRRGSVDDLGC